MSFNQRLKKFLIMIGVNYHKYCEETFSTLHGQDLTLKKINRSNINNFDWAKFLAEKHELILINNQQNTLDSLAEFEKYQNGFLTKYLRKHGEYKLSWFHDDIKNNDSVRFKHAKDLKDFLHDILVNISINYSELAPIYIETNDPDTFLFGISRHYTKKDKKKYYVSLTRKLRLLKIKLLAKSIGLYTFPARWFFPNADIKRVKPDHHTVMKKGVLIEKHYQLETRNDDIIAELDEKKRITRAKALKAFLENTEPVKQNNDNFIPITHGFKSGDTVQCYIYGTKHKLEVSSVYKDDGELLDNGEIDEVNWLIKSNLIDDKQIQFKILEDINNRYDEFCDNPSHKKHLNREFKITTILIDVQKGTKTNNGRNTQVIAFAGECKCDEEHGLSVSFTNRKFSGINSFMEFNY